MTRSTTLCAAALLLLAAACLGAPLLAMALGVDPFTVEPSRIYEGPSATHWLGTDELGRDVLLRLLYGGRVSLTVALVAAASSILIGGSIGLVSGYFGGALDAALMRITEATMALPRLPLMILLLGVDLGELGLGALQRWGGSMFELVLIVVLFGWTTAARLARASAQQIRGQPYVTAARALGASHWRVLLRHVLPNAATPLIVAATLDVGHIVLYESVLSYLGLGVQPPTPSWGAMLRDGMTYLHTAPLLLLVPGALTFATVAAVNVLGDGLRDRLDPRLQE